MLNSSILEKLYDVEVVPGTVGAVGEKLWYTQKGDSLSSYIVSDSLFKKIKKHIYLTLQKDLRIECSYTSVPKCYIYVDDEIKGSGETEHDALLHAANKLDDDKEF